MIFAGEKGVPSPRRDGAVGTQRLTDADASMASESVARLIEELTKLPGIGKKSAERLAYHILRVHENEALALADAIRDVKQNVCYCKTCFNLSEGET